MFARSMLLATLLAAAFAAAPTSARAESEGNFLSAVESSATDGVYGATAPGNPAAALRAAVRSGTPRLY